MQDVIDRRSAPYRRVRRRQSNRHLNKNLLRRPKNSPNRRHSRHQRQLLKISRYPRLTRSLATARLSNASLNSSTLNKTTTNNLRIRCTRNHQHRENTIRVRIRLADNLEIIRKSNKRTLSTVETLQRFHTTPRSNIRIRSSIKSQTI